MCSDAHSITLKSRVMILQAEKYKCLSDHHMKEKVEGSNYRVETEALKQASILVKDSLEPWSNSLPH